MTALKKAVESAGFEHVSTYIQSGNVLFESEKAQNEITHELEHILLKTFNIPVRIVVRSHTQLKKIIHDVPVEWNTRTDIRCYVAFIKEPSYTKRNSTGN